ncbi:N-acetylmuramoyl-L-alanine amidase [Akkermansiaceae bacterium]|nr:N-acetylmuramoyl-L-alanine amidase [Akkermansiaceae bacterium]
MRNHSLTFSCAAIIAVGVFAACSPDPPLVSATDAYVPYGVTMVPSSSNSQSAAAAYYSQYATAPATASRGSSYQPLPPTPPVTRQASRGPSKSASSLYREVGVKKDYLSYSARGRSRKAMTPKYITIHSTQNWSRGADANRHSLALKRGALGRLSWHYTVDEDRAVQHLPTNEQGNHADYNGPGNRYSVGIEMCENQGNSRSQTLERSAKLAAWLMYRHDLPVSRVVPHYKWPRKGKRPENKNCPHFLLDNGRPGKKWRDFQAKVAGYHRQITGG